ncbi:MAG TPA: response regulator [Desulfobacterales bacterium]|nr:response regulator [Desulfobacterales bacterium]
MSIISLFCGSYCNGQEVVRKLVDHTGYRLVEDTEVAASAATISGLSESKIARAFSDKTSVFNSFTHEKQRSIAYLKLALAELLPADNLIISGFVSYLIPKKISHALRVCLIADLKFRSAVAAQQAGSTGKDALKLIRKQDENAAWWVNAVAGGNDPWAPALHDIVIPMDKMTAEEAKDLVLRHFGREIVRPTDTSRQAASDFLLAAKVEVALAKEGHNILVEADSGAVELTINKHVLMLNRLEEELKAIADKVPGVRSIETKVGKDYHQADVYRRYDFELPSKVLLVDDEREFAQTLSERLLMRDMGSAVAYDGESALAMISEEEPEVMILDLKMPGIDGIEVLKRVKQSRPEIEVIILTGHGSEQDRQTCLDLGAFAYLQKPVDIELLTDTLKKANEKMRQNLAGRKAV